MDTATVLKAYPIYPGTTEKFPLVYIRNDEEMGAPDEVTAYGVRFTGATHACCDWCSRLGADALTESGMTGAPAAGIPVHVGCLIEGDGILAPTHLVNFLVAS